MTCSVCAVRLPMSGFWRGCFRRHNPAHFPGYRRVVRLPATSYRRAKGISGKSHLELLPKLVTIEHFDAGNRLPDNVEYEHPFLGRQSYVPVTRTEAALRFRLCVERRAEVAPAAAAVENHQFRHLCCQFPFTLLDEKLPKLSCKSRKHLSEEHLFFCAFVHENNLEQFQSIGGEDLRPRLPHCSA